MFFPNQFTFLILAFDENFLLWRFGRVFGGNYLALLPVANYMVFFFPFLNVLLLDTKKKEKKKDKEDWKCNT